MCWISLEKKTVVSVNVSRKIHKVNFENIHSLRCFAVVWFSTAKYFGSVGLRTPHGDIFFPTGKFLLAQWDCKFLMDACLTLSCFFPIYWFALMDQQLIGISHVSIQMCGGS